MTTKNIKEKYHMIDTIRAIAIINMVLFHFFYSYYEMYAHSPGWRNNFEIVIWQRFICITFILISGFSFHFSRNPLKRGVIINVWGLLITMITSVVVPSFAIWFGILNFMGCAMIILTVLNKYIKAINAYLGVFFSLLLFLIFYNVSDGFINLFFIKINLPDFLYSLILTPFGFPFSGFSSSDYFPIFPWIFMFFTGYFLYFILMSSENCKIILCKKTPILSYIGTKSLFIYLTHQPVAIAICELFFS